MSIKVGDEFEYRGKRPLWVRWWSPYSWKMYGKWKHRVVVDLSTTSDWVWTERVGDEGTILPISMEEILNGTWVKKEGEE